MNSTKNSACYGVVFLLSLALTTNANAIAENNKSNNAHQPFLTKMVGNSDLIFRGELVDISEALSMEEIPYTFVTYKISNVIVGQYPEENITLKFVGGEFPNGNRLSATNSPNVRLGEDAILMVQQRVNTGCDFVECEHGRFLVENGHVIAANESAIVVDNKNGIDYISLAERISGKFSASLSQSSIPRFISHLKSLGKTTQINSSQARQTTISADKNMPFEGYPALAAGMRGAKVPKGKPKNEPKKKSPFLPATTPHDQWEEAQLKMNGGNPVLNVSYSNHQ